MKHEITNVKTGLSFVFFGLTFGLVLGILFGVYEDSLKDFIQHGVIANPELHNKNSMSEIWTYATKAPLYGIGTATISLALILLVMASSLRTTMKTLTAKLIGLINLYPLTWLTMFLLAPSMGGDAVRSYWIIDFFTYISVAGILSGLALLFAHIYFGAFHEDDEFEDNYRRQIVEY